jgi:hypothetical protein
MIKCCNNCLRKNLCLQPQALSHAFQWNKSQDYCSKFDTINDYYVTSDYGRLQINLSSPQLEEIAEQIHQKMKGGELNEHE